MVWLYGDTHCSLALVFPISGDQAVLLKAKAKRVSFNQNSQCQLDHLDKHGGGCPALAIALALLEMGADADVADAMGLRPIHVAAGTVGKEGKVILSALLERTHVVDVLCGGKTPLSIAIDCGNDDAVRTLGKAGACTNQILAGNQTVLQRLCLSQNQGFRSHAARHELAWKLFDWGADPTTKVDVSYCDGSSFAVCRTSGHAIDQIYADYIMSEDLHDTPTNQLSSSEKAKIGAEVKLMELMVQKMRLWNKSLEKHKLTKAKFCEECGRSVWYGVVPLRF